VFFDIAINISISTAMAMNHINHAWFMFSPSIFSIYLRIINFVKLELETHQLNESWGPTLNHGHAKSATSPWALPRCSARSLPRCLEVPWWTALSTKHRSERYFFHIP
jgi:hypothetical protein